MRLVTRLIKCDDNYKENNVEVIATDITRRRVHAKFLFRLVNKSKLLSCAEQPKCQFEFRMQSELNYKVKLLETDDITHVKVYILSFKTFQTIFKVSKIRK